MADFELKIDAEKLQKALVKFPKEVFKSIKKSFGIFRTDFMRKVISTGLSGRPGVNNITGTLLRSFTGKISGSNLPDLELKFAFGVKYAATHEFGDPSRNIPARIGFFKTFKENEKRLVALINKGLDRVAKKV